MLLEHINHYNNLHFAMNFTNVAEEPPHYHNEMELALMLKGCAKYKVHHQDFTIKAGDLFVVDTQDLHYIYESSEDMIMLQFHADLAHFSDEYPNIDVMFFVCEEFDYENSGLHQRFHNKIAFLAHHIAEMMILCQSGGNNELLKAKLKELLYIMVDKFQAFFIENKEFHSAHEDASPANLERLYRIMHHMYVNYDQKITLGDISQLEHLSVHYVSHFIKKTSGLSFQNLLNYIRLEKSEKMLNENKYTLTQVSEACGFSSAAYFNKCFKSWYGMTPAEYRKQARPTRRRFHQPFKKSEALLLLQDYLNTDLPSADELASGGYSTNHLLIPLHSDYESKKRLKETFPLEILIDDVRSLQRAMYYTEELAKLHPTKINIADDVISQSGDGLQMLDIINSKGLNTEIVSKNEYDICIAKYAPNTASAFSHLVDNPKIYVKLFDDVSGLFSMNGLPSPYHTLFSLLDDMEGYLVEKNENYLIVSTHDSTSLLVNNLGGTADLNVHVQIDPSALPNGIIKKCFSPANSIYTALKSIKNPDEISQSMRKNLSALTVGTAEFSSASDMVNYRYNFTAKPDTLVTVHIY